MDKQWQHGAKEDFHAFCRLCDNDSDFRCDNSGKAQILQHATGKVNKSFSAPSQDRNQSKLVLAPKPSTCKSTASSSSRTELQLSIHENETLKAEGIWAAYVANENYSFRSCEDIQRNFVDMFPDSRTARDMTIGNTTVSYLLSEGLGLFFKSELVEGLSLFKSSSTFGWNYTDTDKESNEFKNKILVCPSQRSIAFKQSSSFAMQKRKDESCFY